MLAMQDDVKQKAQHITNSSITPEQCRGARGMLGLGQAQLAEAAQVSRMTVVDFEKGTRTPHANNLSAIRTALEAAGVIFVDENGQGPGVRLRKERGTMTLEEFEAELQRYEMLGRQAKGLQSGGTTIFPGYRFVRTSPQTIDLMVGDKLLGRAVWEAGHVLFDPSLTLPVKDRPFEDDLDEWMSRAQERQTTRGT